MFTQILHFLFFPKVCGICKNKINTKYTCEKCWNILQYTWKEELRVVALQEDVDICISLFCYRNAIREWMLQFKFGGKPYIGYSFAEAMIAVLKERKESYDLVIPVPIHAKRMKERGYNQSAILAKQIGKALQIPYDARMLIKVKNNMVQSTLHEDARRRNVEGVYRVKKPMKKDTNVLLIDDIYTTGATANACARELKKAGAQKVTVMTVAYGHSKNLH